MPRRTLPMKTKVSEDLTDRVSESDLTFLVSSVSTSGQARVELLNGTSLHDRLVKYFSPNGVIEYIEACRINYGRKPALTKLNPAELEGIYLNPPRT